LVFGGLLIIAATEAAAVYEFAIQLLDLF